MKKTGLSTIWPTDGGTNRPTDQPTDNRALTGSDAERSNLVHSWLFRDKVCCRFEIRERLLGNGTIEVGQVNRDVRVVLALIFLVVNG